jgi:hypothetical protein
MTLTQTQNLNLREKIFSDHILSVIYLDNFISCNVKPYGESVKGDIREKSKKTTFRLYRGITRD